MHMPPDSRSRLHVLVATPRPVALAAMQVLTSCDSPNWLLQPFLTAASLPLLPSFPSRPPSFVHAQAVALWLPCWAGLHSCLADRPRPSQYDRRGVMLVRPRPSHDMAEDTRTNPDPGISSHPFACLACLAFLSCIACAYTCTPSLFPLHIWETKTFGYRLSRCVLSPSIVLASVTLTISEVKWRGRGAENVLESGQNKWLGFKPSPAEDN
jgi:hypothetical protein